MKKLIPLLLLSLLACSGENPPSGDEETGAQTAEHLILYEALGGVHSWILSAKTAKFYENDETAFLTEPQLLFRDGDTSLSSIKGDGGTASLEKNLIVLEGNVFGKSASQNAELKTNLLKYDLKEKKIWTDEEVTVRRGGALLRAKGMRANGDLSEIEFKNQTTRLPDNEKNF